MILRKRLRDTRRPGLAFFAFVLAAPLLAGANRWSSQGPDGGAVNGIAVDPRNADVVYAATDGGIWRSANGGVSWIAANNGLGSARAFTVVFDPFDPSTLYAGTTIGLQKSTDGGDVWIYANQPGYVLTITFDTSAPGTIYVGTFFSLGIYKTIDGGSTWKNINENLQVVAALAIDPSDHNTIFASDSASAAWRSRDGGITWELILDVYYLEDLVIDPGNSGTIYAAAEEGIYRSDDGGDTWSLFTGIRNAIDIAIDPTAPGSLFVGTQAGVFHTADRGASWTPLNNSLTFLYAQTLTLADADPSRLYAGTAAGGVFRTSDAGADWQAASSGMTATETAGLMFDPSDSTTAFLGLSYGGAWKSTDGGTTWSVESAGMEERDVHAFALDTSSPGTVYAGTDRSVYRSLDGGITWGRIGNPIGEVLSLAIDPTSPQTLYAGERGYVYKSVDGGATWSRTLPALGSVFDLRIDSHDHDIAFAASELGIFRTVNGGGTWTPVYSGGSSGIFCFAVRIDPTNSSIVYGLDAQRGPVKSLDGGSTWRRAANGLFTLPSTFEFADMTMDPQNPTTLYVSALDGVYRTTDGGASWHPFNDGLTAPFIGRLAVDASGTKIAAGTYASGVFLQQIVMSVTSIEPSHGVSGTSLTIRGTGFSAGSAVTIGGIPATNVVVISPTELTATVPMLAAGQLYDIAVAATDGMQAVLPMAFFEDFGDLSVSNPYRSFAEQLVRYGLTSGCGGGDFCPDAVVTRAQVAVLLLLAAEGSAYRPPPATGDWFHDVPPTSRYAAWIEQMPQRGISSGCGGNNYCPELSVTRAQLAVFLLRASVGSNYVPPPATGRFNDVPASSPFAPWIEDLARRGITAGCGDGAFCPDFPVTRGQAAVLLSRTFSFF